MSKHNAPHADIVGHETTDAEIAPLVRFAVFLTATVLVCARLEHRPVQVSRSRESKPRRPGVIRSRPAPSGRCRRGRGCRPIRSTTSRQLRKEENKVLDHYAWVDQNAGVVRIPIERAIDVLAEKGLPYRQAGRRR